MLKMNIQGGIQIRESLGVVTSKKIKMSTDENAKLLKNIKDIVSCINDLNALSTAIPKKADTFAAAPNLQVADEIHSMQAKVEMSYNESIEKVDLAISTIEELLKKQSNGHEEQRLPTAEEINSLLLNLFKGNPKTRSPPIPNYCGCYASRLKQPSPNQFICANLGGQRFVLMIVFKYDEATKKVTAYDPTDQSMPIKLIELGNDQWTPLPTIIPEKPLARWEHAKKTEVLALCPSNDDWSTNFYPATVISRPCDQASEFPEETRRGYRLDFDDAQYTVPEQYVVSYMDSWK